MTTRRTILGISLASALALGVAGGPVAVARGDATSAARGVLAPARPSASTSPTLHLVAVGDIARKGGAQKATARLVASLHPSRLLLLGDLAYDYGRASEFRRWFTPSYGPFRPITWPIPGNHEYGTANAAGYRSYFHVTGHTWSAHRAGGWLVIGLDSQKVGSTAQLRWLRAVLRANNGRPTLVAWHRPRYSVGVHGDAKDVAPLWNAVARDRDVRLVLWGHDHDYERMALPVTGRVGRLTAVVVGTGGAELRRIAHPRRSWDRRIIAGRYGVLDLVLAARSFTWRFVATGGTVLDHGTQTW